VHSLARVFQARAVTCGRPLPSLASPCVVTAAAVVLVASAAEDRVTRTISSQLSLTSVVTFVSDNGSHGGAQRWSAVASAVLLIFF